MPKMLKCLHLQICTTRILPFTYTSLKCREGTISLKAGMVYLSFKYSNSVMVSGNYGHVFLFHFLKHNRVEVCNIIQIVRNNNNKMVIPL